MVYRISNVTFTESLAGYPLGNFANVNPRLIGSCVECNVYF